MIKLKSVDEYKEEDSLFFVTTQGIVKRVALNLFENINKNGKTTKVKKYIDNGVAFKNAINSPLWMKMPDENGEHGIPVIKVRIFADSVTEPHRLRAQKTPSEKEYKNFYYVNSSSGANFRVALFQKQKKSKGKIVDYYHDIVKIPNGNIATWDFVWNKGAAAVVPVRDDGKLIMVRQYRNAIDRETLEIPAGGLNTPEEPTREAAARELEEETGFKTDDLEFLISIKTTVAFCNENIDIYVAKNLKPSKQNLDEDEFINVETPVNNTNTALIEYKESFFTRFKNFIFKILHINQ